MKDADGFELEFDPMVAYKQIDSFPGSNESQSYYYSYYFNIQLTEVQYFNIDNPATPKYYYMPQISFENWKFHQRSDNFKQVSEFRFTLLDTKQVLVVKEEG